MEHVDYEDLGRLEFAAAWAYQTGLHKALVTQKLQQRDQPAYQPEQQHCFLLVEHPPVYTLGKSGTSEHLLLDETERQQLGVSYFPINRGGDITFHGPGQIVGYPILDLERFFTDVHRYVRSLEEVIIRTLADFGLEAGRETGYTGVWLKEQPEKGDFYQKKRKICAIGVHLSRWVTLHGFALNVNTDLKFFDYIVPCGIADADKTVTSMERELGKNLDITLVKQRLCGHFESVFECRLVARQKSLNSF